MFLRSGRIKVYDLNLHSRVRRRSRTRITKTYRHAEEPQRVSITGSCDGLSNGLYFKIQQSNLESLRRLGTSNSIEYVIHSLHICAKTSLKNNFGKYVKLGGNGSKLVATNTDAGVNLEIWKRDDRLAFCFMDRQGRHYMVSVDENYKFKLIKAATENALRQVIERDQPTSIWFKMCHSGDHGYCIKMAECAKYWAIDSQSVTLTDSAESLGSVFTTPTCQCLVEGCPGVVADVSDAR